MTTTLTTIATIAAIIFVVSIAIAAIFIAINIFSGDKLSTKTLTINLIIILTLFAIAAIAGIVFKYSAVGFAFLCLH
jgi:hypothetical protein